MPKRLLWIVLLVLLLVTLPYLFAAWMGGRDYVFGGFLLNPQDGNSYLAKMYQGWRGDTRFTLAFSADPGEGGYLFLFYLFLGHVARWTGLSLVWVFHLARLLGAVLMLLSLWQFLTVTVANERWRLWAYALASLGLGMGWLVFAFGVITADFWVAETYPFLSAYANPHFALGLALLLYLLRLPAAAGSTASPAGLAGWSAGAAAFLLSVILPFGIVVALAVLGGMLLWLGVELLVSSRNSGMHLAPLKKVWSSAAFRGLARRFAWVAVCGLPLLLYDLWIAWDDPQLAAWNAQNLTLTPPVWDVLLALSPAFLLAVPGAWWALKHREQRARPLLVWALVGAILIYAPLGLQRRFLMGLYVPLAGLAGYGLDSLAARFSPTVARRLAALSLALALPTTLLTLMIGLFGAQTRDASLYLTRSEAQALAWLEANTPADALVLAAPDTGLLIPAHTGRRVLYGHPYETTNAAAEKAQVVAFFQGGQAFPAAFLEQRSVGYIFYGPRERDLGVLPAQIDIRPLFSAGSPGNDQVILYQVTPPP